MKVQMFCSLLASARNVWTYRSQTSANWIKRSTFHSLPKLNGLEWAHNEDSVVAWECQELFLPRWQVKAGLEASKYLHLQKYKAKFMFWHTDSERFFLPIQLPQSLPESHPTIRCASESTGTARKCSTAFSRHGDRKANVLTHIFNKEGSFLFGVNPLWDHSFVAHEISYENQVFVG